MSKKILNIKLFIYSNVHDKSNKLFECLEYYIIYMAVNNSLYLDSIYLNKLKNIPDILNNDIILSL